ncbi:MAG: hypothetical protein GXO56_00835, partial [Chloroflexi bacterium]|nr:hypothetical protein [Chloroflexota bacterium]
AEAVEEALPAQDEALEPEAPAVAEVEPKEEPAPEVPPADVATWVPETQVEETVAVVESTPAAEAPSVTEAPSAPKPAERKRTTRTSARDQALLEEARAALKAGDIATAVKHYAKLIRRRRYLDEIIADLEQALVDYPVDVDLLQTLGDAYLRADRLSEALDAYNKAEALLR